MSRDRKRAKNLKKYSPANGRDFDIEEFTAKEKYETSQTRNSLALLFSFATLLALLAASLHDFLTGSLRYLLSVWAVAGPVLVGIASYYFGRGRKDSE